MTLVPRDKWPSDLEEASKRDTAEVHAKALLYMGLWMEETAHYDTQTILKQYKVWCYGVCVVRVIVCGVMVSVWCV